MVAELRGWATKLSKTKGPTATLEAVEKLGQFGLPKVTALRSALSVAVAASTLRDDHPILEAARAEAKRDRHAIADFYTDEGEATPEHSAATIGALLTKAERLKGRLDGTGSDIELVDEDRRAGLRTLLAEARKDLASAGTAATLDDVERSVSRLEDQVAEKIAESPSTVVRSFEAPEGSGTRTVTFVARQPPSMLPAFGGLVSEWKLPDVIGGVPLGAIARRMLLLLQVALAFYTVAVAAYLPDKSFGDGGDWAALLVAAFATSAVTQIVGLATMGDTAKS
jgi:hypothetical protein